VVRKGGNEIGHESISREQAERNGKKEGMFTGAEGEKSWQKLI